MNTGRHVGPGEGHRREAERHPFPGQAGPRGRWGAVALLGAGTCQRWRLRPACPGGSEGDRALRLTPLPHSPPAPGAAPEGSGASLAPGPSLRGVSLSPADLTASVSLRAVPGFQTGRGRKHGKETEGEK